MTPRRVAPIRRVLRAAAAAPLVAGLLVATASAREPYYGGVVETPYGGDPVFFPPFEDDWTGAEFTGGAVFLETMGGDAAWIAQDLGFWVSEPYEDLCIAEPGEGSNVWDSLFLCSILNGADPGAGAEPDFFLRAPEGSQSNGIVLPSEFGRAFERQPAFAAIRTRPAHRRATGQGVRVAVLDSGIDRAHPRLAGSVGEGFDFVDDDADPSEGVPDGLDQDGDGEPDDGYGHGTTVSGLVRGAAPGARIVPVRVLDEEGRGTAGRIAAGILYALDRDAEVINLSLGGQGYSSAVHDAILRAMERGTIVVAASGNAPRPGFPDFPANLPGVLAATGRVGHDGDVWAPSAQLIGPYPGGRWFRGRGTSFSSALVSGGVAIARERVPGLTPWDVLARLSSGPHGAFRLDLLRLAR